MLDAIYDIEFEHHFTATGTGEGHWGCQKGQHINFHTISITITNYDGEWWGSMTLHHNPVLGLAYSDPGVKCDVQEEFMVALAKFDAIIDANSITGSEQGRQENSYFDCDVDCRPNINKQIMLDLGFKVVDI